MGARVKKYLLTVLVLATLVTMSNAHVMRVGGSDVARTDEELAELELHNILSAARGIKTIKIAIHSWARGEDGYVREESMKVIRVGGHRYERTGSGDRPLAETLHYKGKDYVREAGSWVPDPGGWQSLAAIRIMDPGSRFYTEVYGLDLDMFGRLRHRGVSGDTIVLVGEFTSQNPRRDEIDSTLRSARPSLRAIPTEMSGSVEFNIDRPTHLIRSIRVEGEMIREKRAITSFETIFEFSEFNEELELPGPLP